MTRLQAPTLRLALLAAPAVLAAAAYGCGGSGGGGARQTETAAPTAAVSATEDSVAANPEAQTNIPETIVLESVFPNGGPFPGEYTCDGTSGSPPLRWSGAPAETKSFVLFLEDPDAGGTFNHWVLYNVPGTDTEVPPALPTAAAFDNGVLQGRNSRGGIGYTGPCPPQGQQHRYQFFIFALDTVLDVKEGAPKADVVAAMRGRILARGRYLGLYRVGATPTPGPTP